MPDVYSIAAINARLQQTVDAIESMMPAVLHLDPVA
jgi:hypothetical protein